jgi:hypothetical protein
MINVFIFSLFVLLSLVLFYLGARLVVALFIEFDEFDEKDDTISRK